VPLREPGRLGELSSADDSVACRRRMPVDLLSARTIAALILRQPFAELVVRVDVEDFAVPSVSSSPHFVNDPPLHVLSTIHGGNAVRTDTFACDHDAARAEAGIEVPLCGGQISVIGDLVQNMNHGAGWVEEILLASPTQVSTRRVQEGATVSPAIVAEISR